MNVSTVEEDNWRFAGLDVKRRSDWIIVSMDYFLFPTSLACLLYKPGKSAFLCHRPILIVLFISDSCTKELFRKEQQKSGCIALLFLIGIWIENAPFLLRLCLPIVCHCVAYFVWTRWSKCEALNQVTFRRQLSAGASSEWYDQMQEMYRVFFKKVLHKREEKMQEKIKMT